MMEGGAGRTHSSHAACERDEGSERLQPRRLPIAEQHSQRLRRLIDEGETSAATAEAGGAIITKVGKSDDDKAGAGEAERADGDDQSNVVEQDHHRIDKDHRQQEEL